MEKVARIDFAALVFIAALFVTLIPPVLGVVLNTPGIIHILN